MYGPGARSRSTRSGWIGSASWHPGFLGGLLCRTRKRSDPTQACGRGQGWNHRGGESVVVCRDRDFVSGLFHLHQLHSSRSSRHHRGSFLYHRVRHSVCSVSAARVVCAAGPLLRNANRVSRSRRRARQLPREDRGPTGVQPHVICRCGSASGGDGPPDPFPDVQGHL